MIEITDSAGRTLVLDDAELTEIHQAYTDWMQDRNAGATTCTIAADTFPATDEFNVQEMITHLEAIGRARRAPTSARWEGPPPKRRRGRR